MHKQILLFILTALTSLRLFAHGEDVPGPHGGHIKMPAAFHTEVVAEDQKTFQVYLIDMQFQNPMIQDSAVTAHVTKEKKEIALKCEKQSDHFRCASSENIKSGALIIKATRNGVSASMDAKYDLPLKAFKAKVKSSEDHSMHH